ncbi:MAG: hypothetical protein ACLU4N_13675 [Butyricimonas faecihominis]
MDRRASERWQKPGDKVRFAAFSETYDGMNVAMSLVNISFC